MSLVVGSKKKRQKMTQIDYQIEMLVEMGAEKTDAGRLQLSNLNERKCLMAELGIESKATFMPKFPSKPLNNQGLKTLQLDHEEQVQPSPRVLENLEGTEPGSGAVSSDTSLNEISRQGVPSAYFLFVQHKKDELKKTDPKAKVDRKLVLLTWKKMNESDQKKYYDQAKNIKESLGEKYREDIRKKSLSDVEKKRRKKENDLKCRSIKKEATDMKVKDEKALIAKMKEVIASKESKLSENITYVECLRVDVQKIEDLNKGAVQSVVEKDLEILVLKEHYKNLHKLHKTCG